MTIINLWHPLLAARDFNFVQPLANQRRSRDPFWINSDHAANPTAYRVCNPRSIAPLNVNHIQCFCHVPFHWYWLMCLSLGSDANFQLRAYVSIECTIIPRCRCLSVDEIVMLIATDSAGIKIKCECSLFLCLVARKPTVVHIASLRLVNSPKTWQALIDIKCGKSKLHYNQLTW